VVNKQDPVVLKIKVSIQNKPIESNPYHTILSPIPNIYPHDVLEQKKLRADKEVALAVCKWYVFLGFIGRM